MWDRNTPAITIVAARAASVRRSRSRPPIATCIRASSVARARNPIRVLTSILAEPHDEDGRITIPGFYDGVKELPADVLAQWTTLGLTAETFLEPVGLSFRPAKKAAR